MRVLVLMKRICCQVSLGPHLSLGVRQSLSSLRSSPLKDRAACFLGLEEKGGPLFGSSLGLFGRWLFGGIWPLLFSGFWFVVNVLESAEEVPMTERKRRGDQGKVHVSIWL